MDNLSLGQYVFENLVILLIFLTVALAVSWVAYLKKFFSLPFRLFEGPLICLKDVLTSFMIFFGIYLFFGPLIMRILFQFPTFASSHFTLISIMQFIVFILTVTCLSVYNLFQDPKEIVRIFKDEKFPGKISISSDLFLGMLTWLIAMPVVITFSQISEVITSLFFGKPEAAQVAVDSLKNSTSSPLAFTTILISILMFAPFLEEYLFRGVLQSWLRRKVGSISAIFISALAFAFLHYSPQQEWTNIPLIASLFSFACYLGFIYEKTRSLFASIILHVTFNLISVMRIILIEGN